MPEMLAGIVLSGIAGWVAWTLTAGRTMFVVRLVNGVPIRKRGAVTDKFLNEVEILAREHALSSGSIRGVQRNDGRIALRFSRTFPPGSQQQLRNWWNCNGWTASRR
jgi:hypothetical protein